MTKPHKIKPDKSVYIFFKTFSSLTNVSPKQVTVFCTIIFCRGEKEKDVLHTLASVTVTSKSFETKKQTIPFQEAALFCSESLLCVH